jgi:hypothetical protein
LSLLVVAKPIGEKAQRTREVVPGEGFSGLAVRWWDGMSRCRKGPHTAYELHYHFVFITKYRKPAGAGCDEEFFDVASETGDRLADGTDRELIAKMQHLTDNRYLVLPCGNSPRFFTYGSKIYFESKAAQWPPVDTWNEYHYVTRIDNAQVHDVCGMTFEPHVVGHEGLTTKPSAD